MTHTQESKLWPITELGTILRNRPTQRLSILELIQLSCLRASVTFVPCQWVWLPRLQTISSLACHDIIFLNLTISLVQFWFVSYVYALHFRHSRPPGASTLSGVFSLWCWKAVAIAISPSLVPSKYYAVCVAIVISITKDFTNQDYLISIETKERKNWSEGRAEAKPSLMISKGLWNNKVYFFPNKCTSPSKDYWEADYSVLKKCHSVLRVMERTVKIKTTSKEILSCEVFAQIEWNSTRKKGRKERHTQLFKEEI